MTYQKEIVKVSEISDDFIFVSDSQDTEPIKEQFKEARYYGAFFIPKKDVEYGEITFVYGITGLVPYVWVNAFLIIE